MQRKYLNWLINYDETGFLADNPLIFNLLQLLNFKLILNMNLLYLSFSFLYFLNSIRNMSRIICECPSASSSIKLSSHDCETNFAFSLCTLTNSNDFMFLVIIIWLMFLFIHLLWKIRINLNIDNILALL